MYENAQTMQVGSDQICGLTRGCTLTIRPGQQTTQDSPSRPGAGGAARGHAAHSPALVLGFGNILLSDDGAGVRLIERLRSELGAEAECVDGGTLSFSLLSYIEAVDSMLIVDAAELGRPPGTLSLFEGAAMDEFLLTARRRTVHEVGLIDLLDMARLQDCLPHRRALLCIQPGRIDWCEDLSAPVAAAMPDAARQARSMLEQWRTP